MIESRIDVRIDSADAGGPADERTPDVSDGLGGPDGPGDERPCAHCGRPVPQRNAAGRPFRYCRDNDGECQRAARNARLRQRTSPGLGGQVARAFEVAERLDQVVETLVEALHTELSPDGVERRIAEARAEAATGLVGAHAERDDARAETRKARAALQQAQADTRQARADTGQARDERDQAAAEARRAREALDAARAEATAELAAAAQRVVAADARAERARSDAARTVEEAQEAAAQQVTAAGVAAGERIAAAEQDAESRVAAVRDDAAGQVAAAEAAAHAAGAATAVAVLERDTARREAATEAALRAEAYRERDTARDAAGQALRERDLAHTAVERALREAAEVQGRLQRRLDAEGARAANAEAGLIAAREELLRLRAETDRANGWADDLRGQVRHLTEALTRLSVSGSVPPPAG